MQPEYERSHGVIETNLADELILLDPATQEMFSLNASGRTVWRGLPASRRALVDALLAEYAVAREQAERDVDALIDGLLGAGLITIRDGGN